MTGDERGKRGAGRGVETLDEAIRRQAATVGDIDAESVENVAASVARVQGFTNRGLAASGHSVAVDEPEQFGGGGSAPDPAELMLIAIGASLSVTLTVHAALIGLALDDIRVALTGKLDPKCFFQPQDSQGGGFYDLTAEIELVTAADREDAQALVDRALLASPVLRSIAATPTVSLTVRIK